MPTLEINQIFVGDKLLKSDHIQKDDNASPDSDSSDKPSTQTPKATDSSDSNTPSPSASRPKTLREVEQCGGKGAKCEEYGSCADKPFPGYACAKGLNCNRQNEWWWQVGIGHRVEV